jgi:hypothetical protein
MIFASWSQLRAGALVIGNDPFFTAVPSSSPL